jgi:nicotinamidase-related amidase
VENERQQHTIGLGQIQGSVARALGGGRVAEAVSVDRARDEHVSNQTVVGLPVPRNPDHRSSQPARNSERKSHARVMPTHPADADTSIRNENERHRTKRRPTVTSEPIRDQLTDHLLTPENAALVVIDYQPVQVRSIRSMDQQLLAENMLRVANTAMLYDLPVVLSTVDVTSAGSEPTIPELRNALNGAEELDRTTINAWEDVEFRHAVEATGRRKLVMTALWTEACLTFPTLDALQAGYEIYPVVDAVGGTSVEAHRTALTRVTQAGAKPVSWVQLTCELQRDWAHRDRPPRLGNSLRPCARRRP